MDQSFLGVLAGCMANGPRQEIVQHTTILDIKKIHHVIHTFLFDIFYTLLTNVSFFGFHGFQV